MNREFNQQKFESTFNKHKTLLKEALNIKESSPQEFINQALTNPQIIKDMRDWVKDCEWRDISDEGDVDDLTDIEIVKGVDKGFDGGVEGFIQSGDYDKKDSGEYSHSPEMRVRSDEPEPFGYADETAGGAYEPVAMGEEALNEGGLSREAEELLHYCVKVLGARVEREGSTYKVFLPKDKVKYPQLVSRPWTIHPDKSGADANQFAQYVYKAYGSNRKDLKQAVKDEEPLKESAMDDKPYYVEYYKDMTGEEPFMMGGEKYQFVQAKYPNGKVDIGVYKFGEDMVIAYDAFKKQHNINESEKPKSYGGAMLAAAQGRHPRKCKECGDTFYAKKGQEVCSDCDDENEKEGICHACNGSGEGRADGTVCRVCKGSGSTIPAGKRDDISESTPPNFPADLKKKIFKQYGKSPKAYATMWALHKKHGEKLSEMWIGMKENFNPDEHERQEWERGISKYNKRNPSRFPCPTCGTKNALSAWEHQKGYQCKACADAEEGNY